MVYKETSADFRSGVDFNPGQEATDMCKETSQKP